MGVLQALCSSQRVLEVTRFCHQLGSAGALAGPGHVAFGGAVVAGHPGAPAGLVVSRCGEGHSLAPPSLPACPTHTHGKLLRANC